MKQIRDRMAEISHHLQNLLTSPLCPEIEKAAERRDKDTLVKTCRKLNIPEIYLGAIVSLLLTVGPQQKWPEFF